VNYRRTSKEDTVLTAISIEDLYVLAEIKRNCRSSSFDAAAIALISVGELDKGKCHFHGDMMHACSKRSHGNLNGDKVDRSTDHGRIARHPCTAHWLGEPIQ
jgi:hypothetical protein